MLGVQARGRAVRLGALLAVVGIGGAGCATSVGSSGSSGSSQSAAVHVVAAENFWGSLAQQLGGTRAQVTSIVDNPNTDPHDYEPTAADARTMASARLVIINGLGYDAWATKLADANPVSGRDVITVGDVVGVAPGGNPHRWYSPPDVRTVIDAISSAYTRLDPADAAYFDNQKQTVLTRDLKGYFDTVAAIRTRYAGTPVGASESIFAPLAAALGLRLLTPPTFLDAISQGSDPTAADKAQIDSQIQQRQIKLYVYNNQNATPDVQAQVKAARNAGVEIATISETMTPATASFQSWQVRQLDALRQALARATGR